MRMCRVFQHLAAAVVCCGFPAAACADPNPTPTTQAPAGFVLVEEDQWFLFADEPDRHLGRAREAFVMTDARVAAQELRKAAVHLRVAASHAAERSKAGLVRSEHELDQLARRVESGAVKSVEELDLASARALHALSDYQYVKAADAWRKRQAHQAGEYLRASVDNLDRAAARSGVALKKATAEVVKDSRVISGKLIEGTGFLIDEVGAGFEAVGEQIERVGERVVPAGFSR